MGIYEEVITKVIKNLGIPASVMGYRYVRYAIELIACDMNLIGAIVKEVYPRVAKEFNTTASRAERAIRHAIETGWDRADADFKLKLFGYSIGVNKAKPTNSEFMATVADFVLMTQSGAEKGRAEL